MNAEKVRELGLLLPADSPYPVGLESATRFERLQRCMYDPAFVWNFTLTFAERGQPLPPPGQLPLLLKTWRWRVEKTSDETLEEVCSLRHPKVSDQRDLLHAFLICHDLSRNRIADWMCLPEEVVTAYEELFFNVGGRRFDRG